MADYTIADTTVAPQRAVVQVWYQVPKPFFQSSLLYSAANCMRASQELDHLDLPFMTHESSALIGLETPDVIW